MPRNLTSTVSVRRVSGPADPSTTVKKENRLLLHSRSYRKKLFLHPLLLLFSLVTVSEPFLQETPFFSSPISNVTVRVGSTAQLACMVENIGPYKVAWVQQSTGALLSVGLLVLTSNTRVAVQRPTRNTWLLQLADVMHEDAGRYMCQVNTVPPRKLYGYITVVEPPVIIGGEEWVELDVGASVSLTCKASGVPPPVVTWTRHDDKPIHINDTFVANQVVFSTLTLQNVQPVSAGRYQCLATNGYPPSATKFIQVGVRFSPLLAVSGAEEVFAPRGGRHTLTCIFAAYPRPDLYIVRNSILGEQTFTREYFRTQSVHDQPPYSHQMVLEMTRLEAGDFGQYTCMVNNSEGLALASATLKELIISTTTLPPAMDSPLLKEQHLLVHDNLTVPLLVRSVTTSEEVPEDNHNLLESRKRPTDGWTRKIGRINMARKNKESSGSGTVAVSHVAMSIYFNLYLFFINRL